MKTISLSLLLSLSVFVAQAQIPQPDPDTTTMHFLIVASIKNLQEVSAGEQALHKAKRPEVKSFAQMMIKDHGDNETQLLHLAKLKGIILPSAATWGIQQDLLLKNAGSNFDNVYVHDMVSGHRNTVEVYENYATTGKDQEVKKFAQQMLPALKEHLMLIRKLEETMKAK